jgi:hypothetical protein
MKRLFQALRSKIYPGDIVRNDSLHHTYWYKVFVVDSVGRHRSETYVTYFEDHKKNVCITAPALVLTKLKGRTFVKEWNLIFNKPVVAQMDKPKTLEQLCEDKNIKHLYTDLILSSTVPEFKANMELINKMLVN